MVSSNKTGVSPSEGGFEPTSPHFFEQGSSNPRTTQQSPSLGEKTLSKKNQKNNIKIHRYFLFKNEQIYVM